MDDQMRWKFFLFALGIWAVAFGYFTYRLAKITNNPYAKKFGVWLMGAGILTSIILLHPLGWV